jgi:hypothetical protein
VTASFADNLAALPSVDGITRVELLDECGRLVGEIENKPGSSGSVRVYAYLADKWGAINAGAAEEGLTIYAEHTQEARNNPGSHPNIDRLFDVMKTGVALQVSLIKS